MNQGFFTEYPQRFNFSDLLERDVVPLRTREMRVFFRGMVVLVTGAAGSIGSELCRQLLLDEPACLIALDNNETGLFDLAESVRAYPFATRLRTCIGDITDVRQMEHVLEETRPHIIFHAAAYKHVPLLEQHPLQAIRTNVLATYTLCRLARENGVSHVVFISSDKAAEPISVLGASKRLGELIIQAQSDEEGTCFSAVRFGNVMGSRGSVVPIFARQIEQGGPVTVTDPEATRYFMTIPEACELVILTVNIARSGALYLLDMGKPIRILDLAHRMIGLQRPHTKDEIAIVYTGLRSGEHLHEKLIAASEGLVPTEHSKIFCIQRTTSVPTLTTLEQWMQKLQNKLYQYTIAELRACLLEMVREQELAGVSTVTAQRPSLARSI